MKTAQRADRRDRRRAGRAGGGLHAGGARLRGRLFENATGLGGKAAVLEGTAIASTWGRRSSRCRRCCADLRRGRPRLDDELDLIALDPQWRSFFDDGSTLDLVADRDDMGERLRRFARRPAQGYRRFLDLCATCTTISDRFFFWRSVGSLWDMFDPRAFSASMLGRRAPDAAGQHGRPGRSARTCRAARGADARPLHAVRRLGARRVAGGAVRHRPHADGGGRLVSAGRHPGRAAGTGRLAGELGVEFRTGRACASILDERRRRGHRRRNRGRRDHPAGGGRLQRRRRADAPRAARRPAAERFEGAGATSRPVRAWCSTSAWTARYDICPTTTSSSRATRTRSSTPSTARASRPRSDLLRLRPARDRARTSPRPAARRFTSGPHALPAAGPRLGEDVSGVPQGDPREAGRDGGHDDLEQRIRFERRLTPQDIHDRYRVLDGAIYGLASHGRFSGRSSRRTGAPT